MFWGIIVSGLTQSTYRDCCSHKESDLDKRQTFTSVDELNMYEEDKTSDIQRRPNAYPEERDKKENEQAVHRAYKLAKQSEQVKSNTNEFWKG